MKRSRCSVARSWMAGVFLFSLSTAAESSSSSSTTITKQQQLPPPPPLPPPRAATAHAALERQALLSRHTKDLPPPPPPPPPPVIPLESVVNQLDPPLVGLLCPPNKEEDDAAHCLAERNRDVPDDDDDDNVPDEKEESNVEAFVEAAVEGNHKDVLVAAAEADDTRCEMNYKSTTTQPKQPTMVDEATQTNSQDDEISQSFARAWETVDKLEQHKEEEEEEESQTDKQIEHSVEERYSIQTEHQHKAEEKEAVVEHAATSRDQLTVERKRPPPPPPPRDQPSAVLQASPAQPRRQQLRDDDGGINSNTNQQKHPQLPPQFSTNPNYPYSQNVVDQDSETKQSTRSNSGGTTVVDQSQAAAQQRYYAQQQRLLQLQQLQQQQAFALQQQHYQARQQQNQQRYQRQQQQRQQPQRYQQQQQQQQTPAVPQQKTTQRAQPPAWKSIWRKIEQGLDSLADVEEAVSDRASQLYSTTVASVKELPRTTVKKAAPVAAKIPSVWNSRQQQRAKAAAAPSEQMDFSRFRKKLPASGSTETRVVENERQRESKSPLGGATNWSTSRNPANVQTTEVNKEVAQGPSTPLGAAGASTRKVDWNRMQAAGSQPRPVLGKNSHLIRANGGASTPNDGRMEHPNPRTNGAAFAGAHLGTRRGPNQQPPRAAATAAAAQQRPPVTPGIASRPAHAGALPGGRPIARDELSARTAEATPPPRRLYPDEENKPSILARMGSAIPSLPRVKLRLFGRSGSKDFENSALDAWAADDEESLARKPGLLSFFRQKAKTVDATVPPTKVLVPNTFFTPPMTDLMERCREGEAASLLNMDEEDSCWSIGRKKAVLDLLFLTFMLAGARQMPSVTELRLPQSVVEAFTTTISDVIALIAAATETWAPIAFICAFLVIKTRTLVCETKARNLAKDVEASIGEESQYGSLFLRIVSATAVDRTMPEKMQQATRAQVASQVDSARLRSFVGGVLTLLILMTVSVLRPLFEEALVALVRFVSLEQWRTWPPSGGTIAQGVRSVVAPLLTNTGSLVRDELRGIVDAPLRFAYKASLVAVLLAVALLPMLEGKRRPPSTAEEIDADEAVGEREQHIKFTEQVASLGASGADRVDLLAVDGRIDIVLERWRAMIPRSSGSHTDIGFRSVLRLVCYGLLSGLLLAAPLLFFGQMDTSNVGSTSAVLPRWYSVFDVSFVLVFTQYLVWSALSKTVLAGDAKAQISGFVTSLVATVEERRKQHTAPPPSLHLHASVSPTAGLSVKDLWASHVTKRAWAVRGASLSCPSGEILLLLGDDGAGKTRFITTLAESMVSPHTLSTQRARGSITVGGLDVTKWDSSQLKRRVGISLSDVRSVSDNAQLMTGLSLEEILDPCSGQRNLDPSRSPGPSERAAMMLGLKITGLYSTLLRRLPSKMSTIVTASEEDMNPSTLRPRYQILSPSEWSKLLFARVLAQAIYDNENSVGSNDAVPKSLIGSVLLLDDLTLHFSEVEEARILRDLRDSGAATILTSNRWATGRFVDRIAVVKDGAIVESGTHSELLNRGPQQSIYAAKWHAMSNS